MLRPSSLTDQIFIKAQRIRTVEQTLERRVSDTIEDEFIGIINYSIIALIQLELPEDAPVHLAEQQALQMFDSHFSGIKSLMENKNHDYGEAWRSMRTSSFTDLILMKIMRIKQIEERQADSDLWKEWPPTIWIWSIIQCLHSFSSKKSINTMGSFILGLSRFLVGPCSFFRAYQSQ